MGLSIHYSGTVRHMSLVAQLIDETADVCESMHWQYHIIKETGDEGVNGIVFSPGNCEPIFLTFLQNRKMCSPISLRNKDFYAAHGLDPELIYTTSTKTQYAGPDTHIALLKLLKHLKERYFETFEMDDEGYYWQTHNEEVLFERFKLYNSLMDTVAEMLSNINTVPGQNADSLAERIEKVLRERLGQRKL